MGKKEELEKKFTFPNSGISVNIIETVNEDTILPPHKLKNIVLLLSYDDIAVGGVDYYSTDEVIKIYLSDGQRESYVEMSKISQSIKYNDGNGEQRLSIYSREYKEIFPFLEIIKKEIDSL